jgi:hypothetical protein
MAQVSQGKGGTPFDLCVAVLISVGLVLISFRSQWDLFKTKIDTVDGWIGSSGSSKGKGKGRKK